MSHRGVRERERESESERERESGRELWYSSANMPSVPIKARGWETERTSQKFPSSPKTLKRDNKEPAK